MRFREVQADPQAASYRYNRSDLAKPLLLRTCAPVGLNSRPQWVCRHFHRSACSDECFQGYDSDRVVIFHKHWLVWYCRRREIDSRTESY